MYAITNSRIFDGNSDELRENLNVLVKADRIAALADANSPLPNDCQVLDAGGRVLMPGLIDAHVHACAADVNLLNNDKIPITLMAHHSAQRLGRMLGRGFTTVRDCGGADAGLAHALESGLVKGPHLLYCGKIISQTGGHGDFRTPLECESRGDSLWTCGCSYTGHLTIAVDGESQVRRAVRDNLRSGGSFIKFVASGGVSSTASPLEAIQFSDAEVKAIVDEVERYGTYCTAHIHPDTAIRRAIELGVHCIEHGTMISAQSADLAVQKGVNIVPTVSIAMAMQREGKALGYPASSIEKMDRVIEVMFDSLGHMKNSGVKLGFGTDLLGDLERHQYLEFEARSEVFSPVEILKQATSNNAEILGLAGEIGVIAAGARADILLLNGNPLEHAGYFYRSRDPIAAIIKDGELLPEYSSF